jgi:redox-sensitive bicupin YhaK (pirin superfamily)
MITLRRNTERRHLQRGQQDIRLTFYHNERQGPPTDGFGLLAAFSEMRLPPGGVFACSPREEAEIVSYAYRGALAQEDSTGSSGVVCAGEFQRFIMGRGIRHKETNPSRTDWSHVFRISLHPSEAGLDCVHDHKRFAAAQRHNTLCVVASPDGRMGSLRILQDALIYSSVLDPGRHLVDELLPGRSAWLHVIHGEVTLQDMHLSQGDGVGLTSEPSVSLTSQEDSEILLVDLGPVPNVPGDGRPPRKGAGHAN